jgi:hypothetical protein
MHGDNPLGRSKPQTVPLTPDCVKCKAATPADKSTSKGRPFFPWPKLRFKV